MDTHKVANFGHRIHVLHHYLFNIRHNCDNFTKLTQALPLHDFVFLDELTWSTLCIKAYHMKKIMFSKR